MRVGQYERAFGHERLDSCQLRHGPLTQIKKALYLGQDCRILMQLLSEQLGDQVAGQIIGRRPKTARADDDVRARERLPNCLLNLRRRIGYRNLAMNNITKVPQLTAEPLGVGVQYTPEQQFAPRVDNFHNHASTVSSPATGPKAKCHPAPLTRVR